MYLILGETWKLPLFYQNNFLHHFALLDLFAALFFSGWNLYSHHIPSLPAVRLRRATNDILYTNTFSGSVNTLCSHFIWNTGMSFLFLACKFKEANCLCLLNSCWYNSSVSFTQMSTCTGRAAGLLFILPEGHCVCLGRGVAGSTLHNAHWQSVQKWVGSAHTVSAWKLHTRQSLTPMLHSSHQSSKDAGCNFTSPSPTAWRTFMTNSGY